MTFADLKQLVEDLEADGVDDDARVIVMTQQNWPFENSLDGWCLRSDFDEDEDADDGDYADGDASSKAAGDAVRDEHREKDWSGQRPSGNDIVLLEGRQLGYGQKEAWQVSRCF